MNIEEAIKILKKEPDFSLNYYNRENAIDVLLTAYEKEKEKAKKCEYYEMVADELYKNSVSKDKIKAKIEEYNKMINATYDDLTHYGDCRRDVCIEIKNILQSLLKEE